MNLTPRHRSLLQEAAATIRKIEYLMRDLSYDIERVLAPVEETLCRPISDFEWSVRVENCLKAAGIETIGDLIKRTETDLLRQPHFGRKSLNEVKEILELLGLRLGSAQEEV